MNEVVGEDNRVSDFIQHTIQVDITTSIDFIRAADLDSAVEEIDKGDVTLQLIIIQAFILSTIICRESKERIVDE